MDKIKVGILFGGPSREREVSFAGGRTVYDNLNKSIYEAIPIFVDSHRTLIKLDWEYVYKGTIRDFYPPVDALPSSPNGFQIYVESLGTLNESHYDQMINSVGTRTSVDVIKHELDVVFLALHGEFGEDGQIQSMLENAGIPYTGSGVLPCALGMDKLEQKKYMQAGGFDCPNMLHIERHELKSVDFEKLFNSVLSEVGSSFVIRPANQGSSVGVSILHNPTFDQFKQDTYKAFFIKELSLSAWEVLSKEDKISFVRSLTDIRDGLGFPLLANGQRIFHPEVLLDFLDTMDGDVVLESEMSERRVIFESFINGREFSCITIAQEDGSITALPPTEIKKQGQLYDYKSKYLPGLSRKITPIDLPVEDIRRIREECEKLYKYLSFNTYARIDGFITKEGKIYLNDPNTTSGMMPSSFFFHQAAEIGLDPSQFLSFIIRTSIQERIQTSLSLRPGYVELLEKLDASLAQLQAGGFARIPVGVILGGYSFERHISVESGRNIYEKLASSDKYEPIPIFLKKKGDDHELVQIPINLLLKDNADDISDKIENYSVHKEVQLIKEECASISSKYRSSQMIASPKVISYNELRDQVKAVFIALHGRPGEDGTVQQRLQALGIPHNGSPSSSAQITINKYDTLQLLSREGFTVAKQFLLSKKAYESDAKHAILDVEGAFEYPIIVKPVDDGCSSAVRMIKSRAQLEDYLKGIFRSDEVLSDEMRKLLQLSYNEEFPAKDEVLVEELISSNGSSHFLEITGGLLTHRTEKGEIEYEVFEPSEALAGGEILSLEEKFLAGEGQNITPARFGTHYEVIAAQVKRDLEKAARLLGVEGYARIDAFVRIYEDNRAETVIIEVNSLPGMTPATCIFHQSAINEYKPYDFIDKILEYAING